MIDAERSVAILITDNDIETLFYICEIYKEALKVALQYKGTKQVIIPSLSSRKEMKERIKFCDDILKHRITK